MRIIVTGGAGFIGSNFIRLAIGRYPDLHITNLDTLTYCGNLENLADLQNNHAYRFIKGDIADRLFIDSVLSDGCDAVINFAAESHVDRSILDAAPFIHTNVEGTLVLLEGSRKHGVKRFIQVSTDEVYGSIENGSHSEISRLSPGNPYSASKAAADLLCLGYRNTYNLPVIITRCTNNYGPYQFPEKLIPLAITNLIEGRSVPVYGDGLNVRDWIHVEDHCNAILNVLEKGREGQIYNIAGANEKTNLEIVRTILGLLNKGEDTLTFVKDRPGHDRRYSLDDSKIRKEIGWKPGHEFVGSLGQTVKWYLDHPDWWKRIKTGEYLTYYDRVYADR